MEEKNLYCYIFDKDVKLLSIFFLRKVIEFKDSKIE